MGLPECAIIRPSNKCLFSSQFQSSHSMVSLQKPQKKAAVWEWIPILMSREDLQTGSGGCRGALCSRSGRRRWMGHRCTWAEGDCWSDSGNTEREKWSVRRWVTGLSHVGVWVNPAFKLYGFGNGKDYLLPVSYGIIGQLQYVTSCQ